MAFSLLQTMRPQPDVISFNACLGASASLQPWTECLHLVELMKLQLIQPDTWRWKVENEGVLATSEFFFVHRLLVMKDLDVRTSFCFCSFDKLCFPSLFA